MTQKVFDIATDENEILHVVVKITDEGVIVDLENDDEVIATWGATAVELAEEYCH